MYLSKLRPHQEIEHSQCPRTATIIYLTIYIVLKFESIFDAGKSIISALQKEICRLRDSTTCPTWHKPPATSGSGDTSGPARPARPLPIPARPLPAPAHAPATTGSHARGIPGSTHRTQLLHPAAPLAQATAWTETRSRLLNAAINKSLE